MHHRERQSCQTLPRFPAASVDETYSDDLARNVFGVLGIPLDALDLNALMERIDQAVRCRTPFLLSTPNVNFLMMSRSDASFRESLLRSDLCPVDGMPIVWIARLLGVPIPRRLSGSDIFDALRSRKPQSQKLKVFLFGGAPGAAETVSRSINAEQGGMACVGALNPGFGSIDDMSTEAIVQSINDSKADLAALFLSAQKAQGWLLRNHERLYVPVRGQFGATINLQAGSIRRAPAFVQHAGFEWMWRVKEEPYLWRRYWDDGSRLLRLILTSVLPLSIRNISTRANKVDLTIQRGDDGKSVGIKLRGAATARNIEIAITSFRDALGAQKPIIIDLSQTSTIDPRFFGLLLMVRKQLLHRGQRLVCSGAQPRLSKIIAMNGFGFLLDPELATST